MNIADRGAGIPDGGLFTADQFQKSNDVTPKQHQPPARGALEEQPRGFKQRIEPAMKQCFTRTARTADILHIMPMREKPSD